ncbi:recombinase family protein [Streptomyces buecherae]|uniref:recombinase family protein n=1 Tax=Streptomyces buecherae TaxID=2763006 RepID=UPI0033F29593
MDHASAKSEDHPARLLAAVSRHGRRGERGTTNGRTAKLTRLVFLGRTSTEDKQDPTISLPRQVRSCQSSLPPGVVIVGFYYDVESGRKDLATRGHGRGHERFDIPVPRDGGIQDLLAVAESGDRHFDAVICESIERVARRTYFGTLVEHRLEAVGVPLLAADEPINFGGSRTKNATQVLTRRVKQGVAEWYVLEMLEKSWGGFEEHTVQGYNIGKAPYGYVASRIPHPVPARRSEGKTKTRLLPDPLTAPVVRRIFEWRLVERSSYRTIAARLNEDLASNPPPVPPDPSRGVGQWTQSSVRDVLTNPKHTGHMVWNRRARKTRGGAVNPVEDWVWSPHPTHPPLTSLESFVRAQAVAPERERSRSAPGPNTTHRHARTYALRSFLFCAICERRMFGKTRREQSFYACAPKPGYAPSGHPKSLWIRETRLLEPLHEFFATRVFGPERRAMLATALPETQAAEQHHHEQRERALDEALRDLRKRRDRQFSALELADNPDRRFVQGVQARVAEIDDQIRHTEAKLTDHRQQAPARQDPALIDALPLGRCEIAGLPDAVRRRMFEAFRLQIRFDKRANSAHCRVVLAADTVDATARIAAEAMEAGRSDGAPLPVYVAPPAGLEPAAKRLEGARA